MKALINSTEVIITWQRKETQKKEITLMFLTAGGILER